MEALAERLFAEVRALGLGREGVNRPAYSATETAVLRYLAREAEALGLCCDWDGAGNLWIARPEDRAAPRYDLIGSHVDSVPEGGNFDGLAGVITGLLLLAFAKPAHPLKLLALRGEESAWFGACYLGSKAVTGTLAPDLGAPHKGDGRALAAHMEDLGIAIEPLRQGRPLVDLSQINSYLELHIEQGPLLLERRLPAAIVTGIRGNIRHRKITCWGEGAHSGAVPRAYRRDPVLAMAELFSRLDESWEHILRRGGDLVVTSGMVGTDPAIHAIARIADRIDFSLDIRSQNAQVLEEMQDYLAREMAEIGHARKVRFDCDACVRSAPALMDEALVAGLLQAMQAKGQEPFAMASGAGHDAAVFAQAGVPSAMIFVRNQNGSHNPHEAMELSDMMSAVEILQHYLEQKRWP